MARLSKRETLERQTLYEISYEYIRKNFHKFNEQNKIKIAIAMLNIFEDDDSKTRLGQNQFHLTLITPQERVNDRGIQELAI